MSVFAETGILTGKTLIVLCAITALACVDVMRRIRHKPTHLLFAAILGTALSVGLIRCTDLFLGGTGAEINPFVAALAVLFIVLGWRLLFGPWDVQTKLTLLGTFLFWAALRLFRNDSQEDLMIRAVAAATALVPAAIWC